MMKWRRKNFYLIYCRLKFFPQKYTVKNRLNLDRSESQHKDFFKSFYLIFQSTFLYLSDIYSSRYEERRRLFVHITLWSIIILVHYTVNLFTCVGNYTVINLNEFWTKIIIDQSDISPSFCNESFSLNTWNTSCNIIK
jgi:hypothetical protein